MKAILFDLDGTLLNTVPDIMDCCNKVLAEFSLPLLSEEQTRRFVGNGAKKLVERMLFARQELFAPVYERYVALFPSFTGRTTLYPGERETLLALKERGLRLAIVTNKPHTATMRVYDALLKEFDFDVVQGYDGRFPLKPDPALSEDVIRRLGVSKKDCLFVGDGETDVQTALRLGIPCASVLWGFRSREELKNAGATCFLSRYEELLSIL